MTLSSYCTLVGVIFLGDGTQFSGTVGIIFSKKIDLDSKSSMYLKQSEEYEAKIKHFQDITKGKPKGPYFIYLDGQRKPTIERLIDYSEIMNSTVEVKFGLKEKEKFGDVLYNPKLEKLQKNLSLVMGNFYRKQKSQEDAQY